MAGDVVPQTWIIYFLKINKMSDNGINSITEAMKNWKVVLFG